MQKFIYRHLQVLEILTCKNCSQIFLQFFSETIVILVFFLLLRSYIPGAGGRGSPRVDRCYSPPPPDIERVITYLVSEDFYIKKQSNEVCHSINNNNNNNNNNLFTSMVPFNIYMIKGTLQLVSLPPIPPQGRTSTTQ